MSGYKGRKSKAKVDFGELETIVSAAGKRSLSPEEQKKLQDSHQLLAAYILPVERNTESQKAVLDEPKPSGDEERSKPKGHGRRNRSAFAAARVVAVPHPNLKPGDLCPCGCGYKVYRLKRAGQFRHFVGQAPIQVTLYELEQLRCNACNSVFTADLPNGVGPSSYDASVASFLGFSRYGLGVPFFRQAQHLDLAGTPIAPSTQYEVVSKAADLFAAAYRYLVKLGACGKVGHFDDTRMKILKFVRDEGDDRTGIHTTGVISVHESFQIALFFTGRAHAGENKAALKKQRDPDLPAMIAMSDALASNFSCDEGEDDMIACCLAHGRRNFVKIVDNFPEDCRHVISAIGTVFHNDKLSAKEGHGPEERLKFHQQHSEPVMTSLKQWIDEQIVDKKVEDNSYLGKAIQYLRNHWEGLTLFLRQPGAPLDNNAVERALKRVVLHRKNSLFYRTAKGARTGDIYMSIIQTCQLNDADPLDYLTALQRNHVAVAANPADWMPWNYRAAVSAN